VQSEVVEEPEQYLYSSARGYAGNPGLLKVNVDFLGISLSLARVTLR